VLPLTLLLSKTQCAVGLRSGLGAAVVESFRHSATASTATTHAPAPASFAQVFATAHPDVGEVRWRKYTPKRNAMPPDWVTISDEVRAAVEKGRPVVALESTLIAHGLPWPANVETAREAEAAIRGAGAIPATVAVLSGVPRIGLTDMQLELLARVPEVRKA